MNERERATLLIDSVRQALENGCRHYDPVTRELLPDVAAVIRCLVRHKQVSVHQPRKCKTCGYFEYAAATTCAQCGGPIPRTKETILGYGVQSAPEDARPAS